MTNKDLKRIEKAAQENARVTERLRDVTEIFGEKIYEYFVEQNPGWFGEIAIADGVTLEVASYYEGTLKNIQVNGRVIYGEPVEYEEHEKLNRNACIQLGKFIKAGGLDLVTKKLVKITENNNRALQSIENATASI